MVNLSVNIKSEENNYPIYIENEEFSSFVKKIFEFVNNKKYLDINDLKRIKGHDLKKIMEVGRNFMLNSEEDTTEEEDTEELTESISENA